MVRRVPVAREKNRKASGVKSPDIVQQGGNDLIAAADAERSAGKEIVLDVRNDQGITGCQDLHRRHMLPSSKGLQCIMFNVECSIEHSQERRETNDSLGACTTLPSWRGEGGAARCEAAGPEKSEAYSLEYGEDLFGPRTMQMVVDRSPQ